MSTSNNSLAATLESIPNLETLKMEVDKKDDTACVQEVQTLVEYELIDLRQIKDMAQFGLPMVSPRNITIPEEEKIAMA
jgi:hypothetical protein